MPSNIRSLRVATEVGRTRTRGLPAGKVRAVTYDAGMAHQTGRSGALRVMAAFEELGIGTEGIREHDFGMDLFLHTRNAALVDLGAFGTAQIKSGVSFFNEEIRSSAGDVTSWWFRSDEQHLDYWRQTALPHLVVLHNPVSGISYWRRVRASDVERTGDGWRIAVPVMNTIDREHHQSLLEALIPGPTAVQLEGTAWRQAQPLDPGDANWRLALCAPRLVAPHRNAGLAQPLGPRAAAAMLVQHRLRELREGSRTHPRMPDLEAAKTHRQWGWRFVHALSRWLLQEQSEPLVLVTSQANKATDRAAAVVAAAVALRYSSGSQHALDFLNQETHGKRFGPIDRAWVSLHRARLRLELGDDEAAVAAATRVDEELAFVADPMAGALRGAAAGVLWETSDWGQGRLIRLVRGGDNAFAWWRSQVLASVGGELLIRDVEHWAQAHDRFTAEDQALAGLATVTATSLFLGEPVGAHQRLAQYLLVRATTPTEAADALDRAIIGADTRRVTLAVRHLADTHLLSGITLAASRHRDAWWDRHSMQGLLQFLTDGADLFTPSTADELLREVLPAGLDPAHPRRRVAASDSDIEFALLRAAASLLHVATASAHREAALHLLSSPGPQSPLASRAFRALVGDLDWTYLSEETRRSLLGMAPVRGNEDALRVAVVAAAAAGVKEAVATVSAAVQAGDITLLGMAASRGVVPPVRDYSAAFAAAISAVQQQRVEAAPGVEVKPTGSALPLLVWLCFQRPRQACWDEVIPALADPNLSGHRASQVLRYLVANIRRVPRLLRPGLGDAVSRLTGEVVTSPVRQPDPRGYALALQAHGMLISSDDFESRLHGWMTSRQAEQMQSAADAAVYGPTIHLRGRRALATAFSMSSDPVVRAAGVAVALKRPAVVDPAALLAGIDREGRIFAEQLAVSLRALDPEASSAALDRLACHPSARVRRAAIGADE